jgi:1,4-dihydroxy-2-naphthoate polyprenyltransferase
MNLKIWLLETRPQFLILSLVLAFLGASIGWYGQVNTGLSFNWGYALLAGLGILLAHISCNVLNDYFDDKSGIDGNVVRTPFSGGSGVIQSGGLSRRQVLWLGIISLLLAVPIGIYFLTVFGLSLLPILIVAAFFIVAYTPLILRLGWVEWAPGLGMGFLPVLGAYFVQNGDYALVAIVACVPSFFLVHNLLLLNEFPDVDADAGGGRRTTPILFGKRNAARLFAALTVLTYVWIVGAVIIGIMPVWTLLGLLTLPLGIKAIRGAFHYDEMDRLMPAMAMNVMVVMATQLLLGVGFILAVVV